jgi:hypothetical protein
VQLVDPKNMVAHFPSVLPTVKCRLALHQIPYPGVVVPLYPVIDHVVLALSRFSKVYKHHFPTPLFVNDPLKVSDKELNPVRREARSHDEKDVQVKRLVMLYDGRDRLSTRVLLIVEHNIRLKPPDSSCLFPLYLSIVGYLSTA